MKDWQKILQEELIPAVIGDHFWENSLLEIAHNDISPAGLHLAIFVKPYLSYVLEGKKTVESRFATKRFAPYGQVATGDVILLKQSSGPILGLSLVSQVWFYNLDTESLKQLRKDFTDALCAQDPSFWRQREQASFATLMRLTSVRAVSPVAFPKRDQRGWVVLRPSSVLFQ